jgi:hypothetical protein
VSAGWVTGWCSSHWVGGGELRTHDTKQNSVGRGLDGKGVWVRRGMRVRRRRGRRRVERRRGRCRRWRTALQPRRAPDARGGANAAAERRPSVRAATRGRDGLSFELVHPPGGLVVDHPDRLRCPPLREAATAAALDVEPDRVDRFGRLPVEERVLDHVGVGEARAAVGQTAGERLHACVVNVPRIEPRVDESANVDG